MSPRYLDGWRTASVDGSYTAPCDGAGEPARGVMYGRAICPTCHGVAPVTDDGARIDDHDVKVMDA